MHKDMGGMWMILEFWYYFYVRNYQPVLKENLRNDALDCHPASLFHETNIQDRGQRDLHKHLVSDARSQIDMRMGGMVIWGPWFTNSERRQSEEFESALELSKRQRIYAVKGTIVSAYLARRCMP